MRTRSQQHSKKVYEQISSLVLDADKKKTYGSLCHNFPLMVLRSGLSQAIAFIWVKSKGVESTPQGQFLKHLSHLTEGAHNESASQFQQRINQAELIEYQRLTRKILAASIWYKRFAESILGVKAGEETEEGEPQGENHA